MFPFNPTTERILYRYGKRLGNIHPSDSEYEFQNRVKSLPFIGPWYGDYIRSKSLDERNRHTLAIYGLSPGSATYPHLTGTSNESSSVARGYTMVSHNIASLYRSATRKTNRSRSKRRR